MYLRKIIFIFLCFFFKYVKTILYLFSKLFFMSKYFWGIILNIVIKFKKKYKTIFKLYHRIDPFNQTTGPLSEP